MKKTLLLTLAAGLVCSTPAMALDLYVTGATAFRQNVHDACKNLFDTAPVLGSTLRYGTSATGGDNKTGNSAAQWVMTGNVGNKVTALGSTPLTIHALFTGSVQGIQTVETGTKIIFVNIDGTTVTNTPTIAFSDCASASTPYPATGNFSEESVAIQPFVLCRAVSVNNGVTNINSVTWEQLKYAIQAGRIPLSAWTYKASDHANYVYLLERTKDSGTRRNQFAQELNGFNQSAVVYNYDVTNNVFYKAVNTLNAATGSTGFGVIGAAGAGNVNLNWGSGYVGGGDLRTALGIDNVANQSIGYLSFADAKSLGANPWAQVIAFNGLWPTAAGAGVHGNTGTNDFSPITTGTYACWGNEVVVYPIISPSALNGDQNLTAAQLGDQNTPGTILGVLDAQSTGTPVAGSIEEQIENSKVAGATAIRLSDMTSSRASVGGTITP